MKEIIFHVKICRCVIINAMPFIHNLAFSFYPYAYGSHVFRSQVPIMALSASFASNDFIVGSPGLMGASLPMNPPKIRKEFPESWIWESFEDSGSVKSINSVVSFECQSLNLRNHKYICMFVDIYFMKRRNQLGLNRSITIPPSMQ